jgi:hypothetical protein
VLLGHETVVGGPPAIRTPSNEGCLPRAFLGEFSRSSTWAELSRRGCEL